MTKPRLTRSVAFTALLAVCAVASAGPWGDVRSANLTPYVAADATTKEHVLGQFMDEVNAERSTGRLGFAQAAQLKLAAARTLYPGDGALHELLAFVAMVGAQRDQGQISPEAYDYAVLQKQNEYDARRAATAAQQQQQAEIEARLRYEAEMHRIDAEAAQRADQLQYIEDSIQRNYGQPRPRIGIDIPRSCSTVPDGTGGWRTQCN